MDARGRDDRAQGRQEEGRSVGSHHDGRGALIDISTDEAIALVASGAVLIDVREQDEWDAGHAPTARLLAMSELQQRQAELPEDERLLIICHSGGRSQRVTEYLVAEGYDAVNVAGGMMAWQAAGGDVVTEPAA